MGQKHTLLLVPNYNQTAGQQNKSPLSYLRLGSTTTTATSLSTAALRGDDLLEEAKVGAGFFVDDARSSQTSASGTPSKLIQHADGGTKFSDAKTTYYRYDAVPNATSKTTNKTRAQLTAELETRGGWRDHTDGNRITTVRGDRVDIVMGNYKRVVFGRVEEISEKLEPSTWEVSGGHIYDKTSTGVSELKSIEWVKESNVDGKTYWKVVEETVRGDHHVRYEGRVEDYYNGPQINETVGVDKKDADKNPHIKETSYIGTKSATTTATSIDSTTTVDTYEETVDASKATIREHNEVWLKMDIKGSGTPLKSYNPSLYTTNQQSVEVSFLSFEFETGALKNKGTADSISLSLVPASLDVGLGASASLYVGTQTSLSAAVAYDMAIGLGLEVAAGLDVSLDATKSKMGLSEDQLTLSKTLMGVSKDLLGVTKTILASFVNRT